LPSAAEISETPSIIVGAGLPAMASGQSTLMLKVLASSLANQLPQWFWLCQEFVTTIQTCGSEPARDDGISGDINVEYQTAIAGKPAPTVVLGVPGICDHHTNLWE
jgi:hypothetical protein